MIVYLGENKRNENVNVGIVCKKCKRLHTFEVNREQWYELLAYLDKLSVKKIHEIIPEVSEDIREIFISGICGKCYDELFEMVVSNDIN